MTIITGRGKGEDVFIPRTPLILVPSDLHFEFKTLQFPARLISAMSINTWQSQCLWIVGLDLSASQGFLHNLRDILYGDLGYVDGDIAASVVNKVTCSTCSELTNLTESPAAFVVK